MIVGSSPGHCTGEGRRRRSGEKARTAAFFAGYLIVGAEISACGGSRIESARDASSDRDMQGQDGLQDGLADGPLAPETRSLDPSTPITIPLLPSAEPQFPFQHAAEASIAANGRHVVIAAINLHTNAPDTLTATPLVRGVGVAISHDWGETFGPVRNPGFGASETSDPVVRVTADGVFWLAVIGIGSPGQVGALPRGLLLRSRTQGDAFVVIRADLPAFDKEWLAPASDGGLVMAASGGIWRFTSAGVISASWTVGPDWPVFGGFDDAEGAHFVFQNFIGRWTGGTSFEREGNLKSSPLSDNGWSVPIGSLRGGGIWAAYGSSEVGQGDQVRGRVVLRLFPPGDVVGEEVPISEPGATAFMPAAALDGEGRLHVVWYDSSGASGILKYARSLSADLRQGFSPPRIVDPDACPGAGWFPEFGDSAPDRRLREYIDLSIDGDGRRVHMVWTHAPVLPSRIQTSHLDF
jgi:hypothetical protein